MQFAVGRTETNPKLSIRRREGGTWTGWEGLTAEKAVSLTSGNKTISGNLTCTGTLNISGNTTLNNDTTCRSSLNVAGLALLNRIATYNNTSPDLTAVNNTTTHSIINVFPGINGQQGALTADAYNIN